MHVWCVDIWCCITVAPHVFIPVYSSDYQVVLRCLLLSSVCMTNYTIIHRACQNKYGCVFLFTWRGVLVQALPSSLHSLAHVPKTIPSFNTAYPCFTIRQKHITIFVQASGFFLGEVSCYCLMSVETLQPSVCIILFAQFVSKWDPTVNYLSGVVTDSSHQLWLILPLSFIAFEYY